MNIWTNRFFGKNVAVDSFALKVCAFSLVASIGCIFCEPCNGAVISSSDVWKKAEELGRKNDLDPLLIYSIACAESSLDDHADSGQARGIMQVSHVAWAEVSKLSYDEAWKWETNMEVAAKYLHILRRQLENSGHYSWSILAASYHYGPNRVADSRYRMFKLPKEHNKIYKSLFAGHMPTLPGKVPYREIDRPAAIQAFAKAGPQFSIVLSILNEANFDEIPDEVPDVLEIVPLTPFQADAKVWAPDEMDGIEESQILKPIVFPNANFIAPLIQVPGLESLFVLKDLDLVDGKLTDAASPFDGNAPMIAAIKTPEEQPPEVVVIESDELDTSLNGIVKPADVGAAARRKEPAPAVPQAEALAADTDGTEVAKPEPLDTSVNGIVKPVDGGDAGQLGIPRLKQIEAPAPEE